MDTRVSRPSVQRSAILERPCEPRRFIEECLVDLRRIDILDHLVDDLSHLRAACVAILNGVTFR
jgi:hypothetical protein